MIDVNDINKLSQILSSVFYYGLSHDYSLIALEDIIINNQYIALLEKNKSDFLINESLDEIVESFFKTKPTEKDLTETNSLSLWLGDIYQKIFFYFNKSFSFIFLYLPIKKAIELFSLYHEMDISQLLNYFEKEINSHSVMSLLLGKKEITALKLSALSGINYNTIVSYTRSNDYLYNAKFESLYKISVLLDVNINLFAKNIYNFTISEMYRFDKENYLFRSYLGLFIASYYSSDIHKRNYQFSEVNKHFVYDDEILKILWTNSSTSPVYNNSLNDNVKNVVDEYSKNIPYQERNKHILVIFEYDQISEELDPYLFLKQYGLEMIFIINAENIICISERSYIKYLDDIVINASNIRAKTQIGGDFAI